MPTVLRIGAFRFFFFSHEGNEPAHVHVAASGKEAKIWLENMELASSYGLKPHELAEVMTIAREHRDFLLGAWHEHFKHNA